MVKPKKKPGENNAQFANRLISQAKSPTNFTAPKVANTPTSQPTSQLRPEELAKVRKGTLKSKAGSFIDNITDRSINAVDTVNAAFNPFSKDKVVANFGNDKTNAVVQAVVNHPWQTAAALSGFAGLARGIAAATGKTAVQKAAQVGTTKIITTTNMATGAEKVIQVNTVTIAQTTSFLTKAAAAAKNPTLIANGLMASIGSYPFAGFIKEEALQTISFATKTAMDNGDVEGAKEALAFTDELLNPDTWSKIKAGVPFVNILDSLDNFYEAATIKVAIDKKTIADRQIQMETGETEADKWARNREEQAQQERDNIDYYNRERIKLLEWERQAAIEGRNEDAAFWAKEREKQRKLEEEDRKAIAAFWEAYRKESQRAQDAARPSKLNFGLI